jgi:ELWxxDGT repeat protein
MGTRLLRQGAVTEAVKMRGKLYFTAYDSVHGWELWRSDGTPAGTVLLKDIYLGPESAFDYGTDVEYRPSFLGPVVGGNLFFTADDGIHGLELWRTDGTAAGTVLVKELTPGLASSHLYRLSSAMGLLFFVSEADDDFSLWRSDGTAAGTFEVTSVSLGCLRLYGSMFVDTGQTIFFSNSGTAEGCGLWASNGTPAGTRSLKDISGLEDLFSSQMQMAVVNGSLFFVADRALWRSDGTRDGTVRIKDLAKTSSVIGHVVGVGGTLFFLDSDPGGATLWRSDGTPGGTRRVTRLLTGVPGDLRSCFNGFTGHNGFVFFNSVAEGGESGCELWRSDGTQAGTIMLKDLVPGPASAYPSRLTDVNGVLVFLANDAYSLSASLAKSDGTPSGTVLIQGLKAADFTVVRSLMFIATFNDNNGRIDLWALPLSALGIRFAYLPSIHQ